MNQVFFQVLYLAFNKNKSALNSTLIPINQLLLSPLSPLSETVRLAALVTSPEMAIYNSSKILSVQKLIGHSEQVFNGVVQTFAAVAEEIQAKFQTHAWIPLVISELDVGHNLS